MTTLTSKSVSQVPVQQAASRRSWLMLFSRIGLFAGFQAALAAVFLLAGSAQSWEDAANWWPFTVAATDAACLILLVQSFKLEGGRFWHLFRIERGHIVSDLLSLLAVTILAAPISMLPNVYLADWLFGSPDATMDLIVRPLPLWAVYAAMVVFPLGQGLTELATYFGYVMPRIEAAGMNRRLAVSLPALMLGLQHMAAPLLFDIRFTAWRALMFIPFAFMTGFVLRWRPRLLPYFAAIHALMNLGFATMFLGAAF